VTKNGFRQLDANKWPCDLFMVIAKANFKGNCLLLCVKERSGIEGAKVIQGINTMTPEAVPVKT